MELKQWHGFCLCPLGGACPPDAVPADAPFSPLVFLVRRDPLRSRGLFAVTVLDEVFEAETAGVLLPPAQGTTPAEPLREFVAANGACVLNTAFSAAFSVLERWHRKRTQPLRVTLVGLGDVGGTLLLALKPFLRKERQEKIDRALHAARLASLASLALKNRGRGPGAKETP